jgi:alpha-L-fucosidase
MGFGMFVHWGLYSQVGRGEWTLNIHKTPVEQYKELQKTFTAKDFSGRAMAKVAKKAGMKYITLTSRHHEGFSLYDTRGLSSFDVMHSPAKRDLIKDFTDGCRAEGIVPMLYHTTLDWTEPRFENDFPAYLKYLRDSVEILCTHYGKLGGLWFDGNWSKPKADWQEDKLYAVIRKHQPDAMIINNTGIDEMGKLGNPEIDSVTYERGRPKPLNRHGHPKYITGEMCHTMNFHWGIANQDFNYLSPAHVIEELCFARRAGANLLMNLGPTATGKVPDYESAAFARVGDWIRLHGGDKGVLYHGKPSNVSGEGEDFALEMNGDLYLFITDLTATSNTMAHGTSHKGAGARKFKGVGQRFKEAKWLDNGETLKMDYDEGNRQLTLHATGYPYGTNTVIRIAHLKA